jgi:hypothetical protein
MQHPLLKAISLAIICATPAIAQDIDDSQPADYLAGGSPAYAGQPQNVRPLVGITRKADFITVMLSFTSDTRDAETRKQEIHSMLLSALDRAKASGFELATGAPVLLSLTKENYQSVTLVWAGREDTSKADVMIKVPLSGTSAEASKKIDAFVRELPRKGRGMITNSLGYSLAIRNPNQYRTEIVRAIADDARHNAEIFGPDYRASVEGLDKPVAWAQVNSTDLFLYLPYSYRVLAK